MAAPQSAAVPRGAAAGRLLRPAATPAALTQEDCNELRRAIADCLAERGGTIASLHVAEAIAERYRLVFHRALNVAGRTRFWLLLANEYGLDRGGLKRAVRAFVESSIKVADLRAEQRLAEATAPRAAALFAKIAAGPDGLPALVALRGDLLTLVLEPLKAASSKPDHAAPSNDKPAGVTTTAFQETVSLIARYLTDDRRPAKASGAAPAGAWPDADEPAEPLPPGLAADLARHAPAFADVSLVAHVNHDTLAQLQRLDACLLHLLEQYVVPSQLLFQQITWSSAAQTVERVPAIEAIHRIASLDELRVRLSRPDRRCFGLFHILQPLEPLIVVHVALLSAIPTRAAPLLDPTTPVVQPATATVAAFYSISAGHTGLRGANLGNLLIRRVLAALPQQFPSVVAAVTLSPVPGFRRWAESAKEAREVLERLLTPSLRQRWGPGASAAADPVSLLKGRAATVGAGGLAADTELRDVLVRLCARYLVGPHASSRTVNPVARFHLSNGARLDAIHWAAQTTQHRVTESFGIMVTYAYDRDVAELERNHDAFTKSLTVAHSGAVGELYGAVAPTLPPGHGAGHSSMRAHL